MMVVVVNGIPDFMVGDTDVPICRFGKSPTKSLNS